MINHEHKFLFIHVPRTGGTSIETQFQYNGDEKRGDGKKHFNLEDYKKELTDKQFNTYFKFTFVRNPWDIMISKYVSNWYALKHRGGEIGYQRGKSLKYFLDHYQPAEHEHGDGLLDYFDPDQMDFVGRFENRVEDIKYICEKIGINIDTNIKKRSMRKKKHYTEYYDDKTRDIVAKRYAKDIEYFGYKFGDPHLTQEN